MSSEPRRSTPSKQTSPGDRSASPGARSVIRYALTLACIAMIAMAILTFAGLMPFAPWIGIMFLFVAFADFLVGVVILGKGRTDP